MLEAGSGASRLLILPSLLSKLRAKSAGLILISSFIPSHIISTGCTSSTDALFYASEAVASGRAEIVVSGGADAPIAPGILAGFHLMRILTESWNDRPEKASRPFSSDRDGFVLGEGAWIYIVETEQSAKARGASIYAEILGYGSTCDAHHRVRLDESG